MKILGITAEYNPFHNGHKYHLAKSKELAGADISVVAMSGNFMQRGEPALMDKWIRSECAVKCGADLVVEIPFTFACSRAEYYAKGAVDVLAAAGVTHIAFGCEADSPNQLFHLAEILKSRKNEIRELAAEYMKKGVSSAKANEQAAAECLGKEASELMLLPNNILALEYIKRINCLNEKGRKIEAIPVKRMGSGYFEINKSEGFAGATVIRKMIGKNGVPDFEEIEKLVPEVTLEALKNSHEESAIGASCRAMQERFYELLRYEIIRSSAEELSCIYGIGEGIENRMKKVVVNAGTFDHFLDEMVSKRYTAAAVRRMAMYILMGIKKGTGPEDREPEYIRILAAGENGRKFVKKGKKGDLFTLPLVTNINRDGRELDISRDIKASDLYNILWERDLYSCSDHVVMPFMDL